MPACWNVFWNLRTCVRLPSRGGWTALLVCAGLVFTLSAAWHHRPKQKAGSLDMSDADIILGSLAPRIRSCISTPTAVLWLDKGTTDGFLFLETNYWNALVWKHTCLSMAVPNSKSQLSLWDAAAFLWESSWVLTCVCPLTYSSPAVRDHSGGDSHSHWDPVPAVLALHPVSQTGFSASFSSSVLVNSTLWVQMSPLCHCLEVWHKEKQFTWRPPISSFWETSSHQLMKRI